MLYVPQADLQVRVASGCQAAFASVGAAEAPSLGVRAAAAVVAAAPAASAASAASAAEHAVAAQLVVAQTVAVPRGVWGEAA